MEIPRQAKQYFEKRWVKVAAISIIVLAVIVTLLPVVARLVIQDWYQEQGVESVKIEDVDLNLFTGTFALEGVEVKDSGLVVLSMASTAINLSWLDLFSRQIHIEELDIKEFRVRVERPAVGAMKVAGIPLGGGPSSTETQSDEKGEPWGFGITVTKIENFVLDYKDSKIESEFVLRGVNLNNAFTWTPDNKAVLRLHGEINSSPVSIDADFKPFAVNPVFKGSLKVEGLELNNFAELARPDIAELSGKFHMDTKLDITLKDKNLLEVKADGEYKLGPVAVEMGGQKVALGLFRLEGATEVIQPLEGVEEKNPSVKYKGSTSAQELSVLDTKSNIKLVELGKLAVKGVDVNELENIEVASVSLDQLVLLRENQTAETKDDDNSSPQGTPAISTVESIVIENIKLDKLNSLNVAKVNLNHLKANISRDKNGKLQILDRLGGDEQNVGKKQATEVSKPEPEQAIAKGENADTGSSGFQFKIGGVTVSDKSSIVFKDESVLPKFQSSADIRKLEINNIDNTSKQSESPFELTAKLNKYSDFDIKGKLKLFSNTSDFSFAATLKNYELPPLSSYTSQILGYDLASGQGNIDVHAEKKKDKIDGEAKLRLNNFTVKETNPEYMKKLNEQLSIPLDMALSLLRDKNDDIKLKIPVTGELLKPDVGLGDVINTALGNALKSSTMAYLKFAFQPYGTLISIVQAAGRAGSTIQLDPVLFTAADSNLKEQDNEYLQKIAHLIQDRKGVRIKLCGISTTSDREELLRLANLKQAEVQAKQKSAQQQAANGKALPPVVSDEDMFELASKRAENIKDYLMNNFKIDPARLFVCHPEIKKEQDAKPAVELLM